jgi:hypothetical protein
MRPTRRARGRLDSHRQIGLFRGFGFFSVSGASLVPPAAGNASRWAARATYCRFLEIGKKSIFAGDTENHNEELG